MERYKSDESFIQWEIVLSKLLWAIGYMSRQSFERGTQRFSGKAGKYNMVFTIGIPTI